MTAVFRREVGSYFKGVLGYLLASVLLPELYKSVINLMGNVETYYNTCWPHFCWFLQVSTAWLTT